MAATKTSEDGTPHRDKVQPDWLVLRLPEVLRRTGLSRSSLYCARASGDFPPPIPLGRRSIGWLSSDVEGWLATRLARR